MWKNVIGDHIRRTNRNLLVTNLVVLFGLACALGLSTRYFTNFFHGPVPLTQQALLAAGDPASLPQYWVTIKGESTVPVGNEVERRHGDEHILSSYLVLKLGPKYLLVKRPGETVDENARCTGSLIPISHEVQTNLLDGLFAQKSGLKRVLLPCMLDTGSFRAPGYIGMVIGVPIGLLALWNVGKARKRMVDFALHPTAQALAAYGRPEDVAYSVDSEVKTSGRKIGPVTLTQNWLLRSTSYNQEVRRLDDLVWIYQKVTQHRTNGIPTGKTYSAVFCDRNGKTLEVSAKQPEVDQLLEAVHTRIPWAIVGFDKELAQSFQKDRASVIAAVEQRRQQGNV